MAKSTIIEHDFLGIQSHHSNYASSSNLVEKDKAKNLMTSTSSCHAPFTIFFKSNVSVFHVQPQEAKLIMDIVEKEHYLADGRLGFEECDKKLGDDHFQIARRQSLRHFFERRKRRLSAATPYPGVKDFFI